MGLAIKKVGGFAMKVLLVNGSPHKEGCTYTAICEVLNKYFTLQEMPVISSRYWNMVHGTSAEQVKQDAEGLYTMRVLSC